MNSLHNKADRKIFLFLSAYSNYFDFMSTYTANIFYKNGIHVKNVTVRLYDIASLRHETHFR